MREQDRDAIKRAIYLLSVVQGFLDENPVKEYTYFYDDAECDGYCLIDDCKIAEEELVSILSD